MAQALVRRGQVGQGEHGFGMVFAEPALENLESTGQELFCLFFVSPRGGNAAQSLQAIADIGMTGLEGDLQTCQGVAKKHFRGRETAGFEAQEAEVDQAGGEQRMIFRQGLAPDSESFFEKGLGFLIRVSFNQEDGEIAEAAGDLRMPRPQESLPHGEGLTVEGLGLGEAVLVLERDGEVFEARGNVEMISREAPATDLEGAPVELFGGQEIALVPARHGQSVEARGELGIGLAEALLENPESASEESFGFPVESFLARELCQVEKALAGLRMLFAERLLADLERAVEQLLRFGEEPEALVDHPDTVHQMGLGERLAGQFGGHALCAAVEDLTRGGVGARALGGFRVGHGEEIDQEIRHLVRRRRFPIGPFPFAVGALGLAGQAVGEKSSGQEGEDEDHQGRADQRPASPAPAATAEMAQALGGVDGRWPGGRGVGFQPFDQPVDLGVAARHAFGIGLGHPQEKLGQWKTCLIGRETGQQFLEEDAEGVHVAGRGGVLAVGLLGADECGGASEMQHLLAAFDGRRLVVEMAGQAEVEDLDLTFGGEHDVFRLQIAVDHAAIVGGHEHPHDLLGDSHLFALLEAVGDGLAKIAPVDQLEDQEITLLFFEEAVDAANIGMVEL